MLIGRFFFGCSESFHFVPWIPPILGALVFIRLPGFHQFKGKKKSQLEGLLTMALLIPRGQGSRVFLRIL
jgi:hypothetical protein